MKRYRCLTIAMATVLVVTLLSTLYVTQAWQASPRKSAEMTLNGKKISVDYAVMEGAAQAGLVATVPGDFGWTDVGDFHTLGEVLTPDADGNVLVGEDKADVLLSDASGCVVVPQSGRLVAGLGIRDLIIVDTPDAVLVCPRGRAQEVKKLVDELKERGDSRL